MHLSFCIPYKNIGSVIYTDERISRSNKESKIGCCSTMVGACDSVIGLLERIVAIYCFRKLRIRQNPVPVSSGHSMRLIQNYPVQIKTYKVLFSQSRVFCGSDVFGFLHKFQKPRLASRLRNFNFPKWRCQLPV